MDLTAKLAAAATTDGVIRDLTDWEKLALIDSGHGRIIRSTGRWVVTGAGIEAVQAAARAG